MNDIDWKTVSAVIGMGSIVLTAVNGLISGKVQEQRIDEAVQRHMNQQHQTQ